MNDTANILTATPPQNGEAERQFVSSGLLRRSSFVSKIGTLPFAKHEVRGKRIRLTHLDGKLPNLALMKLSSWLKHHGADVTLTKTVSRELFEPEYDLVLGSSIFGWSANAREIFLREFPMAIIGGTGVEDSTTVEQFISEDWEQLDYSIYPWFKPSIGFSQRGCRLKCSFCVVPKKEGRMQPKGTIASIWRGEPWPKQIILLDNDFFGQPDWKSKCEELLTGGFQVSFNQGINVRLIHKEGAEMLAKLKYRDDQFKTKRIYTAWDNRRDEEIFLRGIRIMLDAGIHPTNITVYFLCGYWPGETEDDRIYRFQKMRELGVFPYPMVWDNTNRDLKRFQQWCLTAAWRYYDWEFYKNHRALTGRKPTEDDMFAERRNAPVSDRGGR